MNINKSVYVTVLHQLLIPLIRPNKYMAGLTIIYWETFKHVGSGQDGPGERCNKSSLQRKPNSQELRFLVNKSLILPSRTFFLLLVYLESMGSF